MRISILKAEEEIIDSKNYELLFRLYRNLESDEECFKVLPEGCSYEGTIDEYFKKICRGYESLPKKI